MVETSTDRLEALITILDYSLKDKLTDTLKRCGIPAAAVLHGSGTAKSAIYDILGYGGPKNCVRQPADKVDGRLFSQRAE